MKITSASEETNLFLILTWPGPLYLGLFRLFFIKGFALAMNSYTPSKPRFWIRPCYTAVSSVRERNEYKFRPYLTVIADIEFLVSTTRPRCLICSPYMHTKFDPSSMLQFHSKVFHCCHCCQSFSLSKCSFHSTLHLHCEILFDPAIHLPGN